MRALCLLALLRGEEDLEIIVGPQLKRIRHNLGCRESLQQSIRFIMYTYVDRRGDSLLLQTSPNPSLLPLNRDSSILETP